MPDLLRVTRAPRGYPLNARERQGSAVCSQGAHIPPGPLPAHVSTLTSATSMHTLLCTDCTPLPYTLAGTVSYTMCSFPISGRL